MRIELMTTSGLLGRVDWSLPQARVSTLSRPKPPAPRALKEDPLLEQLRASLVNIDPLVATQIRSFIQDDKLFEARTRLLDYVVHEDHIYQVMAKSSQIRASHLLEEENVRRTMNWLTLGPMSALLIGLSTWILG